MESIAKQLLEVKACSISTLPEYPIWCGINSRCFNANRKCYKDYGGRGITVCSRFRSFEAFFSDVGKRPSIWHRQGNRISYRDETEMGTRCLKGTRDENREQSIRCSADAQGFGKFSRFRVESGARYVDICLPVGRNRLIHILDLVNAR